MIYYVYIVRCCDGSLYVGHAEDPEERVKRHNEGSGAAYTRLRRPVHLVYYECVGDKASAVVREKQIKKWSRAKKEALICGDLAELSRLSH